MTQGLLHQFSTLALPLVGAFQKAPTSVPTCLEAQENLWGESKGANLAKTNAL